MSNIINFPPSNLSSKNDLDIKKLNENEKLFYGPWDLTCPDCYNKMTFESTGMIFKELKLFCQKCGMPISVKNPGFGK